MNQQTTSERHALSVLLQLSSQNFQPNWKQDKTQHILFKEKKHQRTMSSVCTVKQASSNKLPFILAKHNLHKIDFFHHRKVKSCLILNNRLLKVKKKNQNNKDFCFNMISGRKQGNKISTIKKWIFNNSHHPLHNINKQNK